MSQQHRVAVFGSSFVARLARSPYYHMQIPHIGVEYYGVGGPQLEQVSERPEWKQMKLSRPSIVVLHCGGNSIRRGTSALQLFNVVMSLLRELHWNPLVAVLEIPPRGKLKPRQRLTLKEFDAMRRELNEMLFLKLGRNFVRLRLFTTRCPDGSLSQYFHNDEVHFSPVTGMLKYRKAIRQQLMLLTGYR